MKKKKEGGGGEPPCLKLKALHSFMTIFFDLHTIPSFYKIKTLLVFQPKDQNPPRNTQTFDRNLPRKFDKTFSAKKQVGFLEKDFVGFNQKGGGGLSYLLFC